MMRERMRAVSGPPPWQLVRIVVLIAVVAMIGCGRSDGTAGTPAPPAARVSEAPLEPAIRAVPLVTTRPESVAPSEPATMDAAVPVRLQIPSIGVDSALMSLGLQADRTLEVPPSGFPAGWYTGAPTPGELGPAIIAGHVDWGGRPGVFFDLRDLSRGDDIAVTRQDGSTAHFRVTHVDQVDKDAFPTQTVYGDLDHAGLRLITCGGDFDTTRRSYEANLVVFAELVRSDPAASPLNPS